MSGGPANIPPPPLLNPYQSICVFSLESQVLLPHYSQGGRYLGGTPRQHPSPCLTLINPSVCSALNVKYYGRIIARVAATWVAGPPTSFPLLNPNQSICMFSLEYHVLRPPSLGGLYLGGGPANILSPA
jgi:hypothetical protein